MAVSVMSASSQVRQHLLARVGGSGRSRGDPKAIQFLTSSHSQQVYRAWVDTHRLRYFLRIAEEGSISRAATVLGIAQPALSRQVRLLEEDLGVTLFRRTSRGVELTEEGERLHASAAGPLRQLELAMLYVGSPLARAERGVRVGLPATAARVLATPLLDRLSAEFPGVGLQLVVANTDTLVREMLQRAVDIALIGPTSDGRVFYQDVVVEDLVLVGGPGSGLKPDQAVDFPDLVDHPLVLPASQESLRTAVENTALRLRLRLTSTFATDSLEVTRSLVEAGHGYAVLPLSAVADEIEAGRLRYAPLREPALTQRLGISVTSQLDLTRGFAIKVGDLIREETERVISSGAWAARLAPPPRKSERAR
jgi:DNA-binding transcriptional LysR family regulator